MPTISRTCRPPGNIRCQRHVLLDITLIAVLETLSGVDNWEGIEEFATDQEMWLRTFLELPHAVALYLSFCIAGLLLTGFAFQLFRHLQ